MICTTAYPAKDMGNNQIYLLKFLYSVVLIYGLFYGPRSISSVVISAIRVPWGDFGFSRSLPLISIFHIDDVSQFPCMVSIVLTALLLFS